MLLVAHDVNPLLTYLDRVVYFGAGHAAVGTPREVITAETLSRLYGVPIEVLRAADGRLVVVGLPEAPAHHSDRHEHTIMASHLSIAALSVDLISDFRQLTAYPFMVNALEAGTIVAVMAGVVGWFMVLRRETFAGHTLSVMAFPGATAALLLGLSAAVGYYAFCGAVRAGDRRGRRWHDDAAPRRGVRCHRHGPGVRARRAGSCSSASTRACSPATRTCCSATSSGSPAGRCSRSRSSASWRWRSSRSSAGRCCSPRSTSRSRAPVASRSARCRSRSCSRSG